MTYYITLKGESKENLIYDNHILGETTDNGQTFYASRGFNRLVKIVYSMPQLVEDIEIYDDSSKKLTVDQFMSAIKNCKIQQH
jgi:hypothetical protein